MNVSMYILSTLLIMKNFELSKHPLNWNVIENIIAENKCKCFWKYEINSFGMT